MKRLESEFIPTLAPSTDPSFMNSAAGKWFQEIANTHKEPNGHLQGMYIVSADGHGPPRLFDLVGTYPPGNVLKHMDDSLKFIGARPATRITVPQVAPLAERDYIALPEPTTSVLKIYSRIPAAPTEPRQALNVSVERDSIWVLQGEVNEMLELARSTNGEFPMPPPLVGRMVRYHLVDDLGGRTQWYYRPHEVKRATFNMRALHLDRRSAKLSFTGNWACADDNHIYGIEGEIQGELEIDLATIHIIRFRAYGSADSWGGGSSHTDLPPPGKFKIVYAIVEGNDSLSRNIPPGFAYASEYLDGGYRTLPR